MWNYTCNVDWLQTYCLGAQLEPREYSGGGYKFNVVDKGIETKLFRKVYKVLMDGKEVAEVVQVPRTSCINPRCTLVKLHNRVLYSQRYVVLLYAIQEALHLFYRGITRIDVCCDFLTFVNGRSVPKFISQYVMEPPTSRRYMYRRGSDEFYIRGNKKKNQSSSINYIRLGSKNARVHCYIYDKTQELKDKKDKPWIRQTWQNAGLTTDTDTHVWRAEISIKNEGSQLLDMGTGHLFKLAPAFLEQDMAVQSLFAYYARKYLDFRVKGEAKKRSQYKHIQLFQLGAPNNYTPKYVTYFQDTGRIERVCANKLRNILITYNDLTPVEIEALTGSVHFLDTLSALKRTTRQATMEAHALDGFQAYAAMQVVQLNYLRALDELREKRRKFRIDEMYQVLGGNMTAEDWQEYTRQGYDAMSALMAADDTLLW